MNTFKFKLLVRAHQEAAERGVPPDGLLSQLALDMLQYPKAIRKYPEKYVQNRADWWEDWCKNKDDA